jgi:transcriptional regulator with XRE-family HTH domain
MTGKDIKREREKLGLSQAALAKLLGVAENTVWRWEVGQRKPHPVVLKAIQTVLAEVREKGSRRGKGENADEHKKRDRHLVPARKRLVD